MGLGSRRLIQLQQQLSVESAGEGGCDAHVTEIQAKPHRPEDKLEQARFCLVVVEPSPYAGHRRAQIRAAALDLNNLHLRNPFVLRRRPAALLRDDPAAMARRCPEHEIEFNRST